MLKKFLKTIDGYKAVNIISFSYIVFVCVYMISHRIWFSPDQFFVFGLVGTTFIGKARVFLRDWLPFIFFYLGYEFLRGLVPYVSSHVHIFPMINIDQLIFGFIPTVKLQALLYNPTHLMWYDYVAVTLYICHFVAPMIVGYFFWLKDRKLFKEFSLGILGVAYAAFITYILFPAMPPWMASSFNYIPPIKEVTGVVMSHFFQTNITLPSIYSLFGGNPVAAMPSIHAAFPLMIFFFLFKWNKKVGLAIIPYVLGVWFAVIYLGEHYFIDVAMGALYATVIFIIVEKITNRAKAKIAISPL
ncbi:MAG: phosphatase PAP2 family protein [Candidatus Microgenomates bacterium]